MTLPKAEPPIVVKIGGSTLGGNDTSLQDLVALHRDGKPIVIVHGGGNVISEWMQRQNLAPNFVNGLRVTDAPSLEIVVAVLGGLVNKELTAQMQQLGGPTIGISGMDGCLLQAHVANPDLGYVGEIVAVDPDARERHPVVRFHPYDFTHRCRCERGERPRRAAVERER